jgi:hypothetical protein
MYPIRDFNKNGHKNAIEHEKEPPPPPDFLTTPSTPLKEFENNCAPMVRS